MALKGCFPALVTPMKDGDPVDFPINHEAFDKLIEYVEDNGVDGIVVAGCTGHAASMTWNEQLSLVAHALNLSQGRFQVIAGDGSNSTRETIESAKHMEGVGIETHLMISPYQNKPNQLGLIRHYERVAEAIAGDIILYNVPGRTGRNMEPETVIYLAANHENIVGLKQANASIDQKLGQTIKVLDATSGIRDRFVVYSGDDDRTIGMIELGASGCISVAANVDPARVSASVHHALNGDYASARKLDEELKPLFDVLFLKEEGNPQCCHYALRQLGFDVGVPRMPLCDVSEASARKIDQALYGLGLIRD